MTRLWPSRSSEVSDDALAAAANELKANGVEDVTTQTSVDPIQELKFIPGIDTNKLRTFDNEAKAAAAAASSPSSEQPSPPPPPPSPPPPNLIQDDEDHAPAPLSTFLLLMMTALNFLL
mmetsp:Transcript_11218/g.50838  ORF Transcript_11218/g.50838 Transcript_11218/m.50838 type:complete len:119 (+) Transcript_11218:145-501(+)